MEQNRMGKEKAKCAYVPPLIEVHEAAPCRPLASSPFRGDHIRGDEDMGGGLAGHLRGDSDGSGDSDGNGFAVHIRGNAEYWE